MRAIALVTADVCSCGGGLQKTHRSKSGEDGRAEKSGGLPAGKPLNIGDQLVEIPPAESI